MFKSSILRSALPAVALIVLMVSATACMSDRDYTNSGHMRYEAGQSSSGNHRNNSYRDPNPSYDSNDDARGRRDNYNDNYNDNYRNTNNSNYHNDGSTHNNSYHNNDYDYQR